MDRRTAVLGGGCFWCLEAVYLDLDGVLAVESGYAGGHVPAPTYEQVCGGDTGHAEVVRIEFDADRIGYRDLLQVFFSIHDPTTLNRQGADVGTQYRSTIMFLDDAQREEAEAFIAALGQENVFGSPIVTEVVPLSGWHPAEDYHRRYYERNPHQGYCMVVVGPKVAKFRRQFAGRLKAAGTAG
jgi:peptide-methionine (S)-S-oxide reductase